MERIIKLTFATVAGVAAAVIGYNSIRKQLGYSQPVVKDVSESEVEPLDKI